ncbi:MAG: ABC transporter permease [Planctomycetota bacterium]|nr:MAG: ABC transporter permease [Planctomycetota bacterium]
MYSFFLAMRYIRRRGITYLAVGAVAIGVFALVVVISVMRGFATEMRGKIRGYSSDLIIESKYYFRIRNPEEIEQDLRKYLKDEYEGSAPYVESFILLESETIQPGKVRGIIPEKQITVSELAGYMLRKDEWVPFLKRFQAEKNVARLERELPALESYLYTFRRDFNISDEDYKQLLRWAREGRKLKDKWIKNGYKGPSDENIRGYIRDWAKRRGIPSEVFLKRKSGLPYKNLYKGALLQVQTVQKELEDAGAEVKEYRQKIKDMKKSHKPLPVEAVRACFPERKDPDDPMALVIGVHWLRSLGLYPGLDEWSLDELKGMTSDIEELGDARERKFKITGVFFTGTFEADSKTCYGRLEDIKEFANAKGGVSGVSVNVKNHERVDELREVIKRMESVRKYPDYRVLTWEDQFRTLLGAVELEKRLIKFIIFFMIILAGFLVFALLKIMADTRTRDLGVVKAVGGTPAGVLGIFLASAVIIGLAGSILGLLLALRFGYYINDIADFIYLLTGFHPFPPNVYYLDRIPWFTDWCEVISVVLPTLVISFIVGLVPAWFGARSHPMESLRYE